LQVEHPVTEMITGIDLVKEQISIASGNKISFKQDDIRMNGHAFESRIYAEDFENNFLPSTGELLEYVIPSGPGVRVDNGFGRGSKVSMYYDPLISKLIVWDKDRKSAISRMLRALSEYSIAGVTSNISFLKKIFNHKKFIAGTFDINFIENEFIPSLEKENGKQTDYKLQTIVSIFIAALKEQSSAGNHIRNKLNRDNNKWTELLYE
ncbi:MAG TPA: biotin carboxylase, partial [Ignavibacteria bacterium]|nr:biotin carboxylase [Ignavibacteria bacterium]